MHVPNSGLEAVEETRTTLRQRRGAKKLVLRCNTHKVLSDILVQQLNICMHSVTYFKG